MDSIATPDSIINMKSESQGPFTVKVFFPKNYQHHNETLKKKGCKRMFIQIQDLDEKAVAYIAGGAYTQLYETLKEGDYIRIYHYKVKDLQHPKQAILIEDAEKVEIAQVPDDKSDSISDIGLID